MGAGSCFVVAFSSTMSLVSGMVYRDRQSLVLCSDPYTCLCGEAVSAMFALKGRCMVPDVPMLLLSAVLRAAFHALSASHCLARPENSPPKIVHFRTRIWGPKR